jgi:hypothetical protein
MREIDCSDSISTVLFQDFSVENLLNSINKLIFLENTLALTEQAKEENGYFRDNPSVERGKKYSHII